MGRYILYKGAIQLDTLAIVQYLKYKGIDMQPVLIVERNHPTWVSHLPAVFSSDEGKHYVGINECAEYYEKCTGIPNLLAAAISWKSQNPNFHTRAAIVKM